MRVRHDCTFKAVLPSQEVNATLELADTSAPLCSTNSQSESRHRKQALRSSLKLHEALLSCKLYLRLSSSMMSLLREKVSYLPFPVKLQVFYARDR